MPTTPYAVITFPNSGVTYPMGSIINITTMVSGFSEKISYVNFYSNSGLIGKSEISGYHLPYALKDSGSYTLNIAVLGVSGTIVNSKDVPIFVANNRRPPLSTNISGVSPSGVSAKQIDKIFLCGGLNDKELKDKWYIDNLKCKGGAFEKSIQAASIAESAR